MSLTTGDLEGTAGQGVGEAPRPQREPYHAGNTPNVWRFLT